MKCLSSGQGGRPLKEARLAPGQAVGRQWTPQEKVHHGPWKAPAQPMLPPALSQFPATGSTKTQGQDKPNTMALIWHFRRATTVSGLHLITEQRKALYPPDYMTVCV